MSDDRLLFAALQSVKGFFLVHVVDNKSLISLPARGIPVKASMNLSIELFQLKFHCMRTNTYKTVSLHIVPMIL